MLSDKHAKTGGEAQERFRGGAGNPEALRTLALSGSAVFKKVVQVWHVTRNVLTNDDVDKREVWLSET